MLDKQSRQERFRSQVGNVLRQLKTEGRVSRQLARAVRRDGKKIPVAVRNIVLGWFRNNMAELERVLPEGRAMQAAKIIFGNQEAETRVRLPLLIEAEVFVQAHRRQTVDSELASHLTPQDDICQEMTRIVRDRRFWFHQLFDCGAWINLIETVVPEVDALAAKANELKSVIALYDQEIRAIQGRVRNDNSLTVTELERLEGAVQAAQAQKTELYDELTPILRELAKQEGWLKSAEAQLGSEAGSAFEGLLRLDRANQNIVDELQYHGCAAPVVSPGSVKAEARITVARRFRDRAYVESDVFRRQLAMQLSQAAEPRLPRRGRS